jgi:hypothetical protein
MTTLFIEDLMSELTIAEADRETVSTIVTGLITKHRLVVAPAAPVAAPKVTVPIVATAATETVKEPPNEWHLFCAERRPQLKVELKGTVDDKALNSVVSVALSREWAALGEEGQQPYKARSVESRAAFHVAHPTYSRSTKKGTVSASTYQVFFAEVYEPHKARVGKVSVADYHQFVKERYTAHKEEAEFKKRFEARAEAFAQWCAEGDRTGEFKKLYPVFMKQFPWTEGVEQKA